MSESGYPLYVGDDGLMRCHNCGRIVRHYMTSHPLGYCVGVLREHAARSIREKDKK